MDKQNTTILDVARLAGVSKGTVDRVLHNRGEVSAKSAEKVREAVRQLNYQPNLYASLLASRKECTIACIIPSYNEGEYWEKIHEGILLGSEDVASMGVKTGVHIYDQYNLTSFKKVCQEVLESRPSGVILPPLFKGETMDFALKLKENNIPYVYVDSRIEDENYLAYIGMPMYKSGYLSAALLTDRCSPGSLRRVVVVRILRDKAGQSDPTASRREGFMDYMSTYFPGCAIDQVMIDPSDRQGCLAGLEEYFSRNPEVRHIVMFNSRVHLIAEFLNTRGPEGVVVVGYDDLEKNLEMLRGGRLSMLICQHTANQSRNAVRLLTDYILVGKKPQPRDNFVHMDIITRFNVDNY